MHPALVAFQFLCPSPHVFRSQSWTLSSTSEPLLKAFMHHDKIEREEKLCPTRRLGEEAGFGR